MFAVDLSCLIQPGSEGKYPRTGVILGSVLENIQGLGVL